MTLALEIAVGIWGGGLFLAASTAAYVLGARAVENIQRNRRMGFAWHYDLARR